MKYETTYAELGEIFTLIAKIEYEIDKLKVTRKEHEEASLANIELLESLKDRFDRLEEQIESSNKLISLYNKRSRLEAVIRRYNKKLAELLGLVEDNYEDAAILEHLNSHDVTRFVDSAKYRAVKLVSYVKL